MKWIVLAIGLLIVPYTIITLRYRKPGPAFQPYEDIKKRANVSRLLAAGYQRITLTAQPGGETRSGGANATVSAVAGGLPSDLQSTLVEQPALPVDIVSVSAPAMITPLQTYTVEITCSLPDDWHIRGAELFVRGFELTMVPTMETGAGAAPAQSRPASVRLNLPAGTLKPGRYAVTVVGERASRAWSLEVR
jgi:hypothetical protein